jgi:hypothetical protein
LEQILKKLLLAAVLSLGAIALSTAQAKASEMPCIDGDRHVMEYSGSTLCLKGEYTAQITDDAYYLVTRHGAEVSLVIAQSFDGETLGLSVAEVGDDRQHYLMMINESGIIDESGDISLYRLYSADVGTMLLAMKHLSDSMDLANNLPGE